MDSYNIKVSERTLRRRLNESGLKASYKEKKPRLTDKNIKDRNDYAKRHRYWTINDWSRVIWIDETKINSFSSDGVS